MPSSRVYVLAVVVTLAGCADGPNYYGGTRFNLPSILGYPVSASLGVSVSPSGLMITPNLHSSPSFTLGR